MEGCKGIPRGEEKPVMPDYERLYERAMEELAKSREEAEFLRNAKKAQEQELIVLKSQLEIVYLIFANRR